MLLAIRVCLPDRPGVLGTVAAALGSGGANILSLDVVERDGPFAVDQICVETAPGSEDLLRGALEDLSGVVVEEMTPAARPSDPFGALDLAADLTEASPDEVIPILVDRLPSVMRGTWAAAIAHDGAGPRVLSASQEAPGLERIETPWLPIEAPRRLPLGPWMPASWRRVSGARLGPGIFELAAARLLGPESAVLVGRRSGPRFRTEELRRLGALARVASAAASCEIAADLARP